MFEEYEKLDQVGGGTFGMVFKVRRKADNKTFVWKELEYRDMSDKERQ